MRAILVLCTLLTATTLAAVESQNYCNDPGVNEQWRQALENYPSDPVVIGMAARRETLCDLLKKGEIDLDTAQNLWQEALTKSLLERPRAGRHHPDLLPLFSTF